MLYIVKFFDADVEENTEMEFGAINHAEETYEMYKVMDGIANIELVSYQGGIYTKIK